MIKEGVELGGDGAGRGVRVEDGDSCRGERRGRRYENGCGRGGRSEAGDGEGEKDGVGEGGGDGGRTDGHEGMMRRLAREGSAGGERRGGVWSCESERVWT